MKTGTVWTLLALAAGAMAVAGCQQGTTGSNHAAQTLTELAKEDLQVHWKITLDLNPQTAEKVRGLYYEPDRVYALTTDNRLMGVDAFSGQYLWSADLGDKDIPALGVSQLGRAVFVCILNKLHVLNTMDGTRVRTKVLTAAPTSAPVISGEYIYYGTNAGWFKAEGLLDAAANWDKLTYAAVMAAPTYDATRAYFASIAGDVYASNFNKRLIQWEQHLGAAVVGNLQRTSDGLILVPCRDYVLYALNPSTGQIAWINTTGEPLESSPTVRAGRIYIIKKGGTMLSIDEKTGKTLWQAEAIRAFLAASPRTVFAQTLGGNIVALGLDDGAVKYTLASAGTPLAAVNSLDGQLFVAGPDGQIVAVREKTVTYNDATTTAPAEKPAETPAAKPAEPVAKPAEPPAAKPAETPAEKPAEKAAEKPADKPADAS